MSSEVVIRPAALEDAPAVGSLHARSWKVAYRGILPDVLLDGITEEAWIERLDSPGRVVIELAPQKWISFDGRKVGAHAEGRWQPGDPWNEPDEA